MRLNAERAEARENATVVQEPPGAPLRNADGQTLDDARREFLGRHLEELWRQRQQLQRRGALGVVGYGIGILGAVLILFGWLALPVNVLLPAAFREPGLTMLPFVLTMVAGWFVAAGITVALLVHGHRQVFELPRRLREMDARIADVERRLRGEEYGEEEKSIGD